MANFRVLVAGTGYVGSRLLAALPAESTLGVSRSAPDVVSQTIVHADFDQDLAALPSAESIVYTVPPAGDDSQDLRLARFLKAVRVPPKRFVYVSTSGVYGDCNGQRVDERSRVNPSTARARRRVAAEQLLASWCEAGAFELFVLRVPGIYGPGRLRLDRIQAGEPILREQDAGPANRIHVDDLVTCLLAAVTTACPAGVFNVGDGDHRSSSWFSHTVAELAGLPSPPELSLAEAKEQFSEMRLSFLRESRRLDVRRMREVLRVSLKYPDAREGIRDSLPH